MALFNNWEKGEGRTSDPTARIHRRSAFLFFCFFCVFGLIGWRVVYLHLYFPFPTRLPSLSHQAKRGVIYDSHSNIIAISRKSYSVGLNPKRVSDPARVIDALEQVLSVPQERLRTLLHSDGYNWVRRKIPMDAGRRLLRMRIPGIEVTTDYTRFYPDNELFAHITGFVDIDNIGREGIEHIFDPVLSKSYIPIVDHSILKGYFQNNPEEKNVYLTVDRIVQYILSREIDDVYHSSHARSAFGIIIENRTGRIIGMVSRPTFNPNDVASSSPASRRNRPLIDIFEPGSTFKIFIAAALLEEKAVNAGDIFFCPGYIRHQKNLIRCHAVHGSISFRNVIKKSCNVGMIQAALRISPRTLYKYLKLFGFGEKTKIPLTGESAGILHRPEEWSPRSQLSLSLGYEVGVTGIQLVTAAAAIGNDGILMQPRIVDHISGFHDPQFSKFKPKPLRRVIHPETAHLLLGFLHDVTLPGGTGHRAAPSYIEAAGKTGTAQKSFRNLGYIEGKFISSFVGMIPYHNPQYTILVVIDEPKGDYWGGKLAAPVFRRIADQMAHQLHLLPAVSSSDIRKSPLPKAAETAFDGKTMPDLTGKSKRQVLSFLHQIPYPIRYHLIGSGFVSRQKPSPGTDLAHPSGGFTSITIWFSIRTNP